MTSLIPPPGKKRHVIEAFGMIESILMCYRRTTWLAMAIAMISAACQMNGGEEKEAPLKFQKVIRGKLVMAVSSTGVVEAESKVEVKSKASGEILEFPFEPGDKVEKGQVLIRLDQETEERNVALTEADLSSAKAELESAKADMLEKTTNLKRARSLFAKNLISVQELDLAVAREAVASARIGQVEAMVTKAGLAVENARDRLEETVIIAPMDGVIVEKAVEQGQIITSGITSVTGGNKLMVISDLSRLFVSAQVDETDIGKVENGQKVVITVDAYQDHTFEGAVRRIYPTGQTQDNITVFLVMVEILDIRRAMLRPGMTANVDIVLEEKDDVVIAPDVAIRYTDDENMGLVNIRTQGKDMEERKVSLGLSNGFETEILSGLSEGEEVALRPPAMKE